MKLHIIVSGIPASGKSTVGRAIATALGLAMLDKDDFLEALFHSQDIRDAESRKHLSRTADEALREKALCTAAAVITSWWRHPSSSVDSGTPVEWLSSLSGIVIEIHCVCSPEVAAKRFLSRKRHEGHLDHMKTGADVLANFQQQAALGPLGLGRVVKVDTEQTLQLRALLAEINSGLEHCRSISSPVRHGLPKER
jgi:predicted kinase